MNRGLEQAISVVDVPLYHMVCF